MGYWFFRFNCIDKYRCRTRSRTGTSKYRKYGRNYHTFCFCFSIAPVCLYFKHLYGDNTTTKTKKYIKYYIIVLVVIGMATTRRVLIFNSVFTILLMTIFLAIYNNKNYFHEKYNHIFSSDLFSCRSFSRYVYGHDSQSSICLFFFCK